MNSSHEFAWKAKLSIIFPGNTVLFATRKAKTAGGTNKFVPSIPYSCGYGETIPEATKNRLPAKKDNEEPLFFSLCWPCFNTYYFSCISQIPYRDDTPIPRYDIKTIIDVRGWLPVNLHHCIIYDPRSFAALSAIGFVRNLFTMVSRNRG